MPRFNVEVHGRKYAVEAPDEQAAVSQAQQHDYSQRDTAGHFKDFVTQEPQPGDRSLFGEPEVLAPLGKVIRTAGRYMLPDTNVGYARDVAMGAVGPVAKAAAPAFPVLAPALARTAVAATPD